ncbi:NADPH-dependent F420 reductase [Rosenbergiella australiborealis]|uniref:NADPH-dependent F420 reductase n=1 Tax=Rosenbergiella australiborealis TaxID=1544696 RepID=A0ABS5T9K6_9GAMM|nr:NADPH-dependent F420 reductase [Rosenbergiella australiborealis]MBT0727633.1 NADPH-dependent F420 reductase [Rosenbergiella australiborealis]
MFLKKLTFRTQHLAYMASLLVTSLICSQGAMAAPPSAAPSVHNIGIIGAGNMGETLGKLWADAGYHIMISSRHPEHLGSTANDMGHGTQVGTIQQASQFGDVVVMAVPYGALPQLGHVLSRQLAGKTVIDVSNPYPGRDGATAAKALSIGSGKASAQYLPSAHVVRAFNSLAATAIASNAHQTPPIAIPYAGDNPTALQQASELIERAGFTPVKTGDLATATRFQPGSSLFLQVLDEKALRAQLANSR